MLTANRWLKSYRAPLTTVCLLLVSSLVRGEPPSAVAKERAQSKESVMLIEPAELEKRLAEPSLRLLDARSKDDYAKAHIPGAAWVEVPAWQALGKTEGGFRNAKAWGEIVGKLGIERDSHVIVYGGTLPETARIWWLLKYLGIEHVTILNGGWDAWMKEKRPTDTATPKIDAARFEPRFDADRLAEIDALKKPAASEKVKVVDTRSKDEFTGKEVRGKRGGHIPGATHLEWKQLVAADGRFKTPDQLREVFRGAGILPDETAVCY
jgi:thiosulfate/3-mercaptopyruvate sulfurtransferase